MTIPERVGLVAILGMIILGGIWQLGGRGSGMSASTAALSDSLELTKPAHDSTVDRLATFDSAAAQADSRLMEANQRLAAQVRASQQRAAQERARADSLARDAQTADDWKQAHDVRLAEANEKQVTIDSLSAQVDTMRRARDNMMAARDSANVRAEKERERRESFERLNAGLKTDLRKATECTIAFRIPCPSRTQTLAGVLVARELVKVAVKSVATARPSLVVEGAGSVRR